MPRKHWGCKVEGCANDHHGGGYCNKHRMRLRKNGTLEPKLIYGDDAKRFHLGYIPIPETGCWLWERATTHNGYGQISIGGKIMIAHRYSWELHGGHIPDGLCVLHKCDVRCCVNPDHLWLGTQKDNSQDALKKGRLKLEGLKLGPISQKKPAIGAWLEGRGK